MNRKLFNGACMGDFWIFWICDTNLILQLFVEKIFSNDTEVMSHVTPESVVEDQPIIAKPSKQ